MPKHLSATLYVFAQITSLEKFNTLWLKVLAAYQWVMYTAKYSTAFLPNHWPDPTPMIEWSHARGNIWLGIRARWKIK